MRSPPDAATPPEPDEPAAVVLHFPASTWRFRLRSYVRGLGRPLPVIFFVCFAFGPSAAAWAIMSGEAGGLLPFTLALGVGASLVVIVLSGVAVVAQRPAPSTITITERGIQQEIGGVVREHAWDWVVDFTEEPEAVVLHVQPPPMRSGQLAPAEPQHLVVSRQSVDAETLARLTALLKANAPG